MIVKVTPMLLPQAQLYPLPASDSQCGTASGEAGENDTRFAVDLTWQPSSSMQNSLTRTKWPDGAVWPVAVMTD